MNFREWLERNNACGEALKWLEREDITCIDPRLQKFNEVSNGNPLVMRIAEKHLRRNPLRSFAELMLSVLDELTPVYQMDLRQRTTRCQRAALDILIKEGPYCFTKLFASWAYDAGLFRDKGKRGLQSCRTVLNELHRAGYVDKEVRGKGRKRFTWWEVKRDLFYDWYCFRSGITPSRNHKYR